MKKALALILTAICIASCFFPNDLDYPVVRADILSFEAEGARSVRIDASARTVYVDLEEQADMSAVVLRGMTVTEGASYDSLPEVLDLREPVEVILRTWQEYPWKIVATQEIERYVVCKGQLQEATFNLDTKTVFVYVPDSQPLSSVTIESMKLEAAGSRIVSTTGYSNASSHLVLETREVVLPMTLDCVMERSFDVKVGDKTVVWKFKAIQVEVKTLVSEVDAHSYSARVRGMFAAGGSPVVEYKKAADTDWLRATDVVIAGVGITANLSGLEADTDYVCRVVDGGNASQPLAFHTLPATQLANMGFEDWSQEGKVWYPFLQGGPQVWDSANKATASFTGSATTPDTSFKAEGERSVKLESSYAVVKFASGSIFTGQFVGLQGLGAKLDWGIPFTSKPVALKGQIAYNPAAIDYADSKYASLKGQPDTGHVIILLTDWDAPFRVVSSEEKYVDFDNDPAIIAYGRYALSEKTDGFVPFTLNLEYRNSRTPKWIVIVAASSSLGDYFTGGVGSALWLDALELQYD